MYLSEHKYPENYDKNLKRSLRLKSTAFVVEEGVLKHIGKGGKRCRVIMELTERDRIVADLHSGLVGGSHFGQSSTIRKITDRFFWRSITDDVRRFVKICAVCQKSNSSNRPPAASLHPIAVKGLFHRWGIDLVGPLKETTRGNKYLVVATEYLSRWPEAQAIPDKSANGVHRFVMGLVYRFGACHVLLHDQGREFNNNLVNDLLEKMGTEIAMTSAYHPQSNG